MTIQVNRRVSELCPYVLVFISTKLKAFCVTQNDSPKMEKIPASTNKLSHFSRKTLEKPGIQ